MTPGFAKLFPGSVADAEVHMLPPQWCGPDYLPEAGESIMRRMVYEHPQREAALRGAHEEGLLAEMARSGVDGAVIMGMPWNSPRRCEENNRYVAAVRDRYPDRFLALAVLPSPHDEDPAEAVSRLTGTYGAFGVKVIPSWHGWRLDSPLFEPALARMEKMGLVLATHTDHLFCDPAGGDPAFALLEVARRHPGLKILAPHLGGLLCLYGLRDTLLPHLKNILFLGSVSATPKMIEFAVRSVGAAQVAFATDFPFNLHNEMRGMVEDALALDLSAEERELFFSGGLRAFLDRPCG